VRELVKLDEDLRCGAGGACAVLGPLLAGQIRDRKLAAIDREAPDVVTSANPSCATHLASSGVEAAHPGSLVARALGVGSASCRRTGLLPAGGRVG
jgi:glycolate oxidase iron-sulfur subunit